LVAIRRGGRDAYRKLLGLLGELKTLDPGGKDFGVSVGGVSRLGGCWCARSRPVSVTTMRRDPSQE
jgi:hypothetical protein